MPEIEAGEYLLEALFEAGPVKSNGFGPAALTVTDAAEYGRVMGTLVEPWEFRLLHLMSAAFLDGYRSGADPLAIQPMDRE